MKVKPVLLSAAMLSVVGCASTPPELPVVQNQPPVQEQVPPPALPAAPVPEKRIEAPPPEFLGPLPGTVAHFKYSSGEDRVYFAYDRYDLSEKARDVLRKQADWLQQYGSAIVVIGGNADERGTREYNLALGARRAESVKSFMVGQGVNPDRITTVSYGKERPLDARSTEAAWAVNRNAHTAVTVSDTS